MLKRIYLPGEIYFITTKTFNNQKIFDNNLICELFVKILANCRLKYKFELYGYVIIPDHIHLLIMPDDRMNISDTMHRIKGNFAYQYLMAQQGARNHKGSATRWYNNPNRVAEPLWLGGNVWQKSFYDHIIRNDLDFDEKLDYIHENPLNHNLIDNLDKYPWSSYQNYYLNNNTLIEIDYIT